MIKNILLFAWLLISPITLGSLVPVLTAFFVTKNNIVICFTFILYSIFWFKINNNIHNGKTRRQKKRSRAQALFR